MKVAFVFPYIPYKFAKTPYPSLGIGYLASMLYKHCPFISKVELIDGQIISEDDFWKQVDALEVDIVLISATIRQIKGAQTVAKKVKTSYPNAFVILGGPGPSALLQDLRFLKDSVIDIVVKGEAEETLPKLLWHIFKGIALDDVPNLVISKNLGGQLVSTRIDPTPPDITQIPWPLRSIFDEQAYIQRWRDSANMTSVHIMGSRGCPFTCAFCDRTVTGTRLRYRNVDDVADEMVFLEKRYSPDDIFYFDDLFTVKKSRVLALCNAIKSRSLQTVWSAQGRVDCVDKEMLQAMKEAGCTELMFGVESGSDNILRFLVKGFTREKIIRAFDLCHEVGIKAGAYLIVGVPGETYNDIRDTVSLVERIEPSLLNFSYLTPFPNTTLYTATQHWIGDWDFEQWDDFDNSVYTCKFEVDPREAHQMILDAYQRKIAQGMKYSSYQFANSQTPSSRMPHVS